MTAIKIKLILIDDNITNNNKKNINNSFKFGNSKIKRLNRLVTIPVFNGGILAKLTTNVIDYETTFIAKQRFNEE